MSSAAIHSLRCWLDEDGRHVWQQHDCNGAVVRSMLPTTWRADDATDPTHHRATDVTPSIHCTACEMHTFGTIEGRMVSSAENDTRPRPVSLQEHEIMRRLERMIGYVPVGSLDLLRCLAHPDVIDLTAAYLDAALGAPKATP